MRLTFFKTGLRSRVPRQNSDFNPVLQFQSRVSSQECYFKPVEVLSRGKEFKVGFEDKLKVLLE